MTKTKKVVRTIVVAGVLCSLAAIATFSAFSSQTENPGNNVTAGTVQLGDNDSGTAMYNMTAAKPGQSSTAKCIRVAYTGSLDSTVKLYTPTTIPAFGQYVNVKVEAGSQAAGETSGSCTGFAPASGAALYDGRLDQFPTGYSGGLTTNPASASKWVNGDAVAYRVTATLSASTPDSAQGGTTGAHVLRWDAQNQ
jgi:predicted ribosomally synthesized peptide with SipW-like signal peptide